MKKSVLFIARASLIGALYFVLTISIPALSFGPLQFSLSEALVLLAVIFPEAIPGLTIGCVLSNFFFSPYGIYDMVFGGLATLLGAVGTHLLRKNIPLSAIPPIIFNTLLVPVIFILNDASAVYYIAMFEILPSEVVTVGVIGIPLTYGLKKAFAKAGITSTKKTQNEKDFDLSDDESANALSNSANIGISSDDDNASTLSDDNSSGVHTNDMPDDNNYVVEFSNGENGASTHTMDNLQSEKGFPCDESPHNSQNVDDQTFN